MAKPFLKWAGGKTSLVSRLLDIFPPMGDTYFEPFLGGGAIFWALAEQGRFTRAVLNDWNQELADTYRAIRDFPEEVIDQLALLKWDKDLFLELRAIKPQEFSPCRRAARMIYLNKTCFNGLYRVNKKGQFNVPFGKFKREPKFLDAENLRACAALLNRYASIYNGDFTGILDQAREGDLVYFDPPYVKLNKTSDFTSYTSEGFSMDDQHRLAHAFRDLAERGVWVVLSNSDTEPVRQLYKGFEMHEVQVRRSISAKADTRGDVGELIVVSRPSWASPNS